MKFSEEFGDEVIRVELSNGHIVVGKIEDENDSCLILKKPKLLYNDGTLWKSKRIIVTKDRIVDIEEYDPKEIIEEMKENYKDSLRTPEIFLGTSIILIFAFIFIAFG